MLQPNKTLLIVIDVQGRLATQVEASETLFKNLRRLLQGMQALDIPVLFTEQIPSKLGATRDELQAFITTPPISKTSFGCCGELEFVDRLNQSGRTQVLLCGIETHICVYQTAMELTEKLDSVSVIVDAVSSRDPANKAVALRRMEREGIHLTATEMVLFELLGSASSPAFKPILQLVK